MGSQPGTAIPICARAIEALAFGIKGVAAHADHAWVLGQKDDAAFALIHNTLAATVNPSITLDGLMDLILECGRINLRAMEIPNQGHTESPLFPGAILMTTNCIQEPSASYLGNIFTTGLVAWPGVTHIARDDFTALLERAQDLPGFGEHPGKRIQVGFGHNAMLSVSDRLIEAVKQGVIRHFFLIAGCDGAKPGRKYYTEFARNPQGRHHPDARLRQIPLQYPGTRHRGRPAPRVGHRAVQRCLPGCSNRGGSGQVL